MSDKFYGRATIRVNGQFYDTEPGAELVLGGIKNTARPTTHGVGYSQSYTPSRLTCRVPYKADMTLRDLQEMTEAEVTLITDTGQTFVMKDAFQTGDVTITDGDSGGFAALVFEAAAAEEILD